KQAGEDLEDHIDRMERYDDNVQKSKTEWHNSGVALQARTTLDHGNFAQLIREGTRRKGAKLTAEESSALEGQARRFREAESDHTEAQDVHNERLARIVTEQERLLAQMSSLEEELGALRQERQGGAKGRRAAVRQNLRQERQQILKDLDSLV